MNTSELEQIVSILKESKAIKATLFGSRAIGNYKIGSDIDIAIIGDITEVSSALNENNNLPYFFDIVNLNTHIKRVGIKLI